MGPQTIGWIALAVVVFVLADLLLVEIRRAIREGKRLLQRVNAYSDLPIFSLASSLDRDIARVLAALAGVSSLLVRAEAALIVIRRPFQR